MNEQLSLLISLQEIDSAILAIAESIESLPNKLNSARALLKKANTAFEKFKAEYQKVEKQKKQKEGELEETQEKINKLKAKSAEVKTNKEYEAYLKEIKAFEDTRYQIEENILSAMETIDALSGNMKQEEAEYEKAEEKFRQEEKALEEEKNRLSSDIDTYKSKRKDLADKLDNEIYNRYVSILEAAGGVAVVPVQNEVCLGCNTNIPPQLYNDIKNNDDIFSCCYCNRFLFYRVPSDLPGVIKTGNDTH